MNKSIKGFDRLKELLTKARSGPTPKKGASPTARRPEIQVIIGLDFGTRFTKVCYRFYGDEKASIAVQKPAATDGAFWPSSVFVDPSSGAVHLTPRGGAPLIEHSYLKMRLKDPLLPVFKPHPRIEGHMPLGSERALAAFYLATVIRQARAYIIAHEKSRIEARDLRWQINLSIPAKHKDDGVSEVFRAVGEVALLWSDDPSLAAAQPVALLSERFMRDAEKMTGRRNVEVFPELVAALHHFVRRPDTPQGIHGFLDIGGGTLDACVFRFNRQRSGPQLAVLAAEVEPLGTIAISKKAIARLYRDMSRTVEERLVAATEPEIPVALPLDDGEECVRVFTGKLLSAARDKMPYRTLKQPPTAYESDPTRLSSADRFVLHCSGGGASSSWYKRAIEGTHAAFNHAQAGIMPYSVGAIESPTDFPNGPRTPFARFVIAHGLSSPAEDLELVRCWLPSETERGPSMPPRPDGAIDYLATKELT
jgi:hypothetical protein